MNAPTIKRMTVPEFLAWAETQKSGRYELFRGQIVAMAPERWEHVEAKQRAFRALETAIARAGIACQALIDGLAVVVDFRVPSIAHYLIIDLGRWHVLHYRRQLDGTIMVAIIKDGEIVCSPPGIAIDVASLLG